MRRLILPLITMLTISIGQVDGQLTLTDCRLKAIEYNQDVRSSQVNVEVAGERSLSAKKDFYPRIDFTGNYTYQGITPDGGVFDVGHNLFDLNASLSLPIYAGGAIRKNYEFYQALEDLAAGQRDFTTQEIMFMTDQAYWNIVALKEFEQLGFAYLATLDRLVQDIQNKVEGELISKKDLLMVQVTYNDADLDVLQVQNQLATARMDLNRLMGEEITAITPIVDSIIVDFLLIDSADAINRGLSLRPEIDIEEANVEASQKLVKLTMSNYLPQLFAGFSGQYGIPGVDFDKTPDFNYFATANLAIPIFYWGKRKKEVSASKLEADIAQLQLEKATDLVMLDIEQQRVNLYESMRQYNLAEESLEIADENLDIVFDRYDEGLTAIIEVLYAQLFWQQAKGNFISAKLNFQISLSAFQRSVGEYLVE